MQQHKRNKTKKQSVVTNNLSATITTLCMSPGTKKDATHFFVLGLEPTRYFLLWIAASQKKIIIKKLKIQFLEL